MKTLKYRSNSQDVFLLEEILVSMGYDIHVSTYFGKDTHQAIMDFQKNNNLVIDGICGPKTWSKIIESQSQLTSFNDKFLSEQDLIDFAAKYDLELAAVKAHLQALSLFCRANKLFKHLKSKNWATFAKGYNGSGYKLNKYDLKLETAYIKYL